MPEGCTLDLNIARRARVGNKNSSEMELFYFVVVSYLTITCVRGAVLPVNLLLRTFANSTTPSIAA